jgi:hypothetical protein
MLLHKEACGVRPGLLSVASALSSSQPPRHLQCSTSPVHECVNLIFSHALYAQDTAGCGWDPFLRLVIVFRSMGPDTRAQHMTNRWFLITGHGLAVDPCGEDLAPQREALRCAAGPEQKGDCREARLGPGLARHTACMHTCFLWQIASCSAPISVRPKHRMQKMSIMMQEPCRKPRRTSPRTVSLSRKAQGMSLSC